MVPVFQTIISVESLDIQPNYKLSSAFDALAELQDGWLDGAGVAPDKDRLSLITDEIVTHYPEGLALPAIVPTPEGNILLEWHTAGSPSVDLNLDSFMAEYHAFTPDGGDIEHTFELVGADQWQTFFVFLESNVGDDQA